MQTQKSNLTIRIEPELKKEASFLFKSLGLDLSTATGIFYRQALRCHGLPFEVKLPQEKPVAYGSLTKEQFDAEMEKGIADIREGRVYTADEVEDLLHAAVGRIRMEQAVIVPAHLNTDRVYNDFMMMYSAFYSNLVQLECRTQSGLSERFKVVVFLFRYRIGRVKLNMMENRLQVLQTRIRSADPRNILQRGYVLAVDAAGVPFRQASDRKAGDIVSLMFRDGVLECEVKNVKLGS